MLAMPVMIANYVLCSIAAAGSSHSKAALRTRGKQAAEKPPPKPQPAKRQKVGGNAVAAAAPTAPVAKRRAPVSVVKQAVKNQEDSEPEAPPPKSARSVERSRGGKRTSGKYCQAGHTLLFPLYLVWL